MPELAEVTLIVRNLKPLIGLRCIKAELLGGKLKRKSAIIFKKLNNQLPRNIEDINNRGKFIYIEFDDEKKIRKKSEDIKYLGISLGMVGKLEKRDSITPKKQYDHVIFTLENKSHNMVYLVFNDHRNFGNICPMSSIEFNNYISKKVGIPLDKLKDWKHFYNTFKNTNKGKKMSIARILLRQDIISGIGNYMRAEALYNAKINPHRLKNELSSDDYRNLYLELMRVYVWALTKQYKQINYNKKKFTVYRQSVDPLGNNIVAESLSGRTIYWVPKVQK